MLYVKFARKYLSSKEIRSLRARGLRWYEIYDYTKIRIYENGNQLPLQEVKISSDKIDGNAHLTSLYQQVSCEECIIDNRNTAAIIYDAGGICINQPHDEQTVLFKLSRSVNYYKSYKAIDYNNNPISMDKADHRPFPNEPYATYYLNALASDDEIKLFIKEVYDLEDKPMRMHIGFGCLFEKRVIKRNRASYEYFSVPPYDDSFYKFSSYIVANHSHMRLFIEYVFSLIELMINRNDDSSTRLICIFSLAVKVFRLTTVGSVAPGLDFFVKSNLFYTSCEDNGFCWDYCAIKYKDPSQRNDKVNKTAKIKAYERVTNKQFTSGRSKDYQQFVKSYQGFNPSDEQALHHFCEFYQVNVSIYISSQC